MRTPGATGRLRSPRSIARLGVFIAVACMGCTPNGGTSSPSAAPDATNAGPAVACDPLAPPPTTLGTILAVGQDTQGTFYVADQSGCSFGRVFVSDGTGLEREHVLGSGTRGDGVQGDSDDTFSFEDPSDADGLRALLIQVRAGVVTAVALGPGSSRGFIGDPGIVTQPLTVADPSAVAGLAVHNLAGSVFEAYDVSNGDALVITAPAENCSDTDLRLFYGPPSAVLERSITSFGESLSGATYVSFLVDSTTYALSVPIIFGPDSGPLGALGPGTLEMGDAGALMVTGRPSNVTGIDGLSFLCLQTEVGAQGIDGGP